jgi:hypothetical protein
MNVPARPGCSLDLQPRAENDRPLHPRTVFWHRRGQPSQYPSVHWDNALRGRRAGRHGPLLWEIWFRDANACQVDADLAPRCRDRSSVGAVYTREERRADGSNIERGGVQINR